MKKIIGLVAAALLLGTSSAMAMDSATLLSQPERYRVIYADQHEVAYADMNTLSGMATMDYPGSLENMHFTMYVETYKPSPDAFDFARGNLISHIREFQMTVYANKREQTYGMEKTLSAIYDAKGKKQDKYSSLAAFSQNRQIAADAKTLFLNLDHQSRPVSSRNTEAKPVVP